jgi:hypothetical protein
MTVALRKTYSAQLLSLRDAQSCLRIIHHKCAVLLRTIAIFYPPITPLNTFVFAHQISQNR